MNKNETVEVNQEQLVEVENIQADPIVENELKSIVGEKGIPGPKGPEEPKSNRNELLRELSKEYGVNLFDADGIEEFKKYQESKVSELEKVQKELEEYKRELEKTRLNTLRLEYGLDEEKFDDFLVLAESQMNEDTTAQEAFKKTLDKYGDIFVAKRQKEEIRLGVQVDNDRSKEAVKTFDQEVLEAYFKRKR